MNAPFPAHLLDLQELRSVHLYPQTRYQDTDPGPTSHINVYSFYLAFPPFLFIVFLFLQYNRLIEMPCKPRVNTTILNCTEHLIHLRDSNV